MRPRNALPGTTPVRPTVPAPAEEPLWAIVLAGGEGTRLRPLVRHLFGDDRPKQYATLIGSRSLLRQTLDRVARLVPPRRTVVVTNRAHGRYLEAEFGSKPAMHVLAQPADRGTAAGILFPAHWIHWRDPAATVAIFASDHFVLEERAFMDHVGEVAAVVERDPRWIVLVGAQPTEPETEYGWIEPGERLDSSGLGSLRRSAGSGRSPRSRSPARAWEDGACGTPWSSSRKYPR
jgi:mannose-1-phosphate guanylyltransferase